MKDKFKFMTKKKIILLKKANKMKILNLKQFGKILFIKLQGLEEKSVKQLLRYTQLIKVY